MSENWFLHVGALSMLYIWVKTVWGLIMYSRAYLTLADPDDAKVKIFGNFGPCDIDTDNWFITVIFTLGVYFMVSMLVVFLWPILFCYLASCFMQNKRAKVLKG